MDSGMAHLNLGYTNYTSAATPHLDTCTGIDRTDQVMNS